MKGKFADKVRLEHMLDAISEIEFYNEKTDFETFCKTSIIRFASIKQIEIIGEAANGILEDTRLKFSQIEWKRIIGLKNILIHEYFGVDAKIVWDIIRNDIPILKNQILTALHTMDQM